MMQGVYSSLDSMWYHAVSELLNCQQTGSRDGDTREFIGYSGVLSDPAKCWVHNPRRHLSPFYAAGEILWYASPNGYVNEISPFAPSYEKFAERNGRAYGAYGSRLSAHGGLVDQAVSALKSTPLSRRCVVSLWSSGDLHAGHGKYAVKDVPCTLCWQFIVRENKLNMIVTMRSQDVWLGMPYDVFWNCTAMRLVANELCLQLGTYIHQCGSLHIYERNVDAAKESMKHTSRGINAPKVWSGSKDCWSDIMIANATCVKMIHDKSYSPDMAQYRGGLISTSLLKLCKSWLKKEDVSGIDPVLSEAVEVYNSRSKS